MDVDFRPHKLCPFWSCFEFTWIWILGHIIVSKYDNEDDGDAKVSCFTMEKILSKLIFLPFNSSVNSANLLLIEQRKTVGLDIRHISSHNLC